MSRKRFSLQHTIAIVIVALGSMLVNHLLGTTAPTPFAGEPFRSSASTSPSANESAELVRVIDGDTVKVRRGTATTNVRLIGIDAPESSVNDKALRDAYRTHSDVRLLVSSGVAATKFLRGIAYPGMQLTLEFDTERLDKYQRLLAYVYLADGRMVNELMLQAGYAQLLSIQPNTRYQDRFRKALSEARSARRGLWGHAASQ